MAMTFVPGYDKHVTWQADGDAAAVTIHLNGWDVDDSGDLSEVTNTATDAHQAFVATIKRTGVNVTAFFYTEVIPSAKNIIFGKKGTITVKMGTGSDGSYHVIIEKVHHKSVVNGVLTINFDCKSDAIKADGTIVNPITRPA